MYKKFIFEIVT